MRWILAPLTLGSLLGCTPAAEPRVDPALSGSKPDASTQGQAVPAAALCSSAEDAKPGAELIARVEVRGLARVPKADVCKTMRTKAGDKLDEQRLREDASALWDLGLFDDVSVRSRPSAAGSTLTLILHERPLVRRSTVHGVQAAHRERVSAAFPQTGHVFDQVSLRRSIDTVREDYLTDGYRRTDVQFKVHPAPDNQVDIDFSVSEGPRAMLQSIVLKGFSRAREPELRALIDTGGGSYNAPGKPYRADTLERDRLLMSSFYYDRGMVRASIAEEVVTLSADGTSATLTIEIDEGPVYKLGKRRCVGDLAGSEKKCLDLLGAKQGDVFSRAAINQGMDRVRQFQEQNRRGTLVEPEVSLDEKKLTADLTISIAKSP